jgi:hypothetical protein
LHQVHTITSGNHYLPSSLFMCFVSDSIERGRSISDLYAGIPLLIRELIWQTASCYWCYAVFLVPVRISGRLAIITDVLVFFLSYYTLIWQTDLYYCCGFITLFFYAHAAERMSLLKILYAFLKYQLNQYGAASCYILYD